MKTYNSGFYTLMDEAGLLNSQNFSLYIDNVLGYGNTQALKLDGFSFEPVNQLDFDYRQLQIENQLKVMATYTDKDSEAILNDQPTDNSGDEFDVVETISIADDSNGGMPQPNSGRI